MRRTQIILIDSDMRRRARVAYEMTNLMSYVLPLEDVAEICGTWPEEAVVLIEDSRDNIARLDRVMSRQDRRLPFIAFSAVPTPQAEARARTKGAAAYLAWPCDPAALNQAVIAAQNGEGIGDEAAEDGIEASEVTAPIIAIAPEAHGDYLISDPHVPATPTPVARNVTREVAAKIVTMPLARAH